MELAQAVMDEDAEDRRMTVADFTFYLFAIAVIVGGLFTVVSAATRCIRSCG